MPATPCLQVDWNAINAIAASFAAIFTFCATWAALHIARKTDRRQMAESKMRAGLVAALSLSDLEELHSHCNRISDALTFGVDDMVAHLEPPNLLPGSWDAIIGKFPLETLIQLEPLTNSAGYRTARAVGDARNCAEEIREVGRSWWAFSPEIKKEHIAKWEARMSEAATTLRAVSADFKAAAHDAAKPLTDEERGYVV